MSLCPGNKCWTLAITLCKSTFLPLGKQSNELVVDLALYFVGGFCRKWPTLRLCRLFRGCTSNASSPFGFCSAKESDETIVGFSWAQEAGVGEAWWAGTALRSVA